MCSGPQKKCPGHRPGRGILPRVCGPIAQVDPCCASISVGSIRDRYRFVKRDMVRFAILASVRAARRPHTFTADERACGPDPCGQGGGPPELSHSSDQVFMEWRHRLIGRPIQGPQNTTKPQSCWGLGLLTPVVGHSGLEPETSPLSEECSSQLS